MMFLLDTEVVAELRGARTRPAGDALASWASATPLQSLFLPALALAELEHAAQRAGKRNKDAGAAWQAWIADQLMPTFEGRILPVDGAVALRAARLGYPELRDGLLAATAAEHNLTLATRRTAAFRSGRIKLLNPWRYDADSPDDADWREATKNGSFWLKNLFVRA